MAVHEADQSWAWGEGVETDQRGWGTESHLPNSYFINSGVVVNPANVKWNSPQDLYAYLLTIGEEDNSFYQAMLWFLRSFNDKGFRSLESSDYSSRGYFTKDMTWVHDYCKNNSMIEVGTCIFYLFDDNNCPIGLINLDINDFACYGTTQFVDDFVKESKNHYEKIDYSKTEGDFIELTGFDSDGPVIDTKPMGKALPVHNSYYPFLNGGPSALMKDFLESSDPLMILTGIPGCGKTGLIFHSIQEFNIVPLLARDFEAINNANFITTIFKLHDAIYAKGEGVKEEDSFTDNRSLLDPLSDHFPFNNNPRMNFITDRYRLGDDEIINVQSGEENYIPLIIIEDANNLIRPREHGNMVMQNLLNRLAGMGNEYPVKIIITANITDLKEIDSALIRPGRCYGCFEFRDLSAEEARAARKDCGFEPLESLNNDKERFSLAQALQVPRKRIMI